MRGIIDVGIVAAGIIAAGVTGFPWIFAGGSLKGNAQMKLGNKIC